jgi:uncharacterized protein (TIGR00730 family)
MKRICVFCGSNPGRRPAYRAAAIALGHLLVERDIGLVYGGGNIGLMGIIADAVLEKDGSVIGVIPKILTEQELAHQGIPDLRVVKSMHERKALMADLSDGFIALPGGFGTFEEFCEIVTWSQLGLQEKPCGLLNVENYYQPLLSLFDRAVEEGFLMPENRKIVLAHSEPTMLLDALLTFKPVSRRPWLNRNNR